MNNNNSHEYVKIQSIVRKHTGNILDIHASKMYDLKTTLNNFAYKISCQSIETLIEKINRGNFKLEHELAIFLLNKSSCFFRDKCYLNSFITDILPFLVSDDEELLIWSACCSKGQEPYSLSFLLSDSIYKDRVKIIASDISGCCIKSAKSAHFNLDDILSSMSDDERNRYFIKEEANYQVKKKYRSLIDFKVQNLLDDKWDMPKFDVVFLKNILRYMHDEEKKLILAKIKLHLRNAGALIVSSDDHIEKIDPNYKRCEQHGTVFYSLNEY